MLKIPEIINDVFQEKVQEIIQEIKEVLGFLSVFALTTTDITGARIEGSEIESPIDLKGKKFKITNVWISAVTSTAAALLAGDNLLVGLMIDGKPLFLGASQTINAIEMTLDMLPVPVIDYYATGNILTRRRHFNLLSETFTDIKKIQIIYAHKSTNTVHYLVYLTIGGVIL